MDDSSGEITPTLTKLKKAKKRKAESPPSAPAAAATNLKEKKKQKASSSSASETQKKPGPASAADTSNSSKEQKRHRRRHKKAAARAQAHKKAAAAQAKKKSKLAIPPEGYVGIACDAKAVVLALLQEKLPGLKSVQWHPSLTFGFAKFTSPTSALTAAAAAAAAGGGSSSDLKAGVTFQVGSEPVTLQLPSKAEAVAAGELFLAASLRQLLVAAVLRQAFEGLQYVQWNPLLMHGTAAFQDGECAKKAVAKGQVTLLGSHTAEVTGSLQKVTLDVDGEALLLRLLQAKFSPEITRVDIQPSQSVGLVTFQSEQARQQAVSLGKVSILGQEVQILPPQPKRAKAKAKAERQQDGKQQA